MYNLFTKTVIMINSINVSDKTNEELIKDLEAKKAEAVASDDFEKAIKIRDQIKELKSKEMINEPESNIAEKVDQIEANSEKHQKEMDSIKVKSAEDKKDKINDLVWQLNDISEIQSNNILNDCKESFNSWKEYFNAISWDQKKIDSKIESFSYYKNSSNFITNFYYLDNATEEELKDAYLKYFEPQNSPYYLWGLIADINSEAFRKWFFEAMNWKDTWFDENFNKKASVIQKLWNISRKIYLEGLK